MGIGFCARIASSGADELMSHLAQSFERRNDFGMFVNPEKCVFGDSHVAFLLYMVNAQDTSRYRRIFN